VARRQTHRGLAPKDARLFAPNRLPLLRQAAVDLCWLLDRGYALRSAVELVGNRYALLGRQRLAVSRCVCAQAAAQARARKRVEPETLRGQELWLDGYNVLTVLESALAGGVVLLGRDGCCRDIAGVHRRYRKVTETIPALHLIGRFASALGVTCCRWWLDKPVSNSARLKSLILDVAARAGWNMSAELAFSPDGVLARTEHVIATSDSAVLDRCQRWVNLARLLIAQHIPQAKLVDLSLADRPMG
jgi:hypothetical protein